MITELVARYDGRDSFYGKAQVENNGKETTLYSYGTAVVRINGSEVTFGSAYNQSQTTLRHVREFLKQTGHTAIAELSKKALEKYVDENKLKVEIN